MRKNRFAAGVLGALALTTLTQCFTDKQNQGQKLYVQHCQSCHMEDGSGLRGLIPPIAKADYLQTHRDELACLIRNGASGPMVVNGIEYNKEMPGVLTLREDEITNLLNYIQTNFGNKNERYTFPEVEEMLEACPAEKK
ncbi:cytochrome c [Pontibacter sp. KCTC 32443]|uniref:c-type cytochrome n=1 Tax=Pontibacter TaxID=323449 RepID=UPI00164ECDCE|nr:MULTISPECIES: cytochrome c [Pontibacter]MBC5772635.1 cytochrome c [Pontibacter sp. KCTC 32443]